MANYNINAVTRRVVYTGSAGVGPYAFSFEILTQTDVDVYFNTTLLTLTTDYTVTINANGTGSITIVTGTNVPTTPDADDQIIIVGSRDIERTTDFVTAGDFRASAINEQLDALTIFDQQLLELSDRALTAPVTDPTSINMTLPAKDSRKGKYLAFNATTGDPEAGASGDDIATLAEITDDIATLADIEDGTDATDAIQTVAGISSNVSTVSGISGNVTTVAGVSANVTTVAGVSADVTTVAGVATSVPTVAGVAADVTTVAGISADVTTAATNVTDITNFADVYIGPSASDPTQRADTSALQAGDLYFNTTVDELRVYSGSQWVSGTAGTLAVQRYSGDGSTVAFTLATAPAGENNTQVYISGVYQQKDTYSVSGTTLTFSAAPPIGTDNIEVVTISTLALGETDASLVTYTPAGTGAVERTVQSVLRDTVSVKDFGAVGDGVTDDTTAIQAAINYVKTSTSRLTVDLGGSPYLISQALVINEGDCGIANGKLIADASSFADDGSGESGSEAMLRVRQGLRITVDNIEFECNDIANGIACETNGFGNIYRHLEILECKDFGILLDTGSSGDQRIINCLLTGNDTPTLRTGTGIDIQTGDIKVENCTVRYFDVNMVVNGNTLLCSDCHFYNGYTGADAGEITANINSVNIRIDGGSGQTFSGCYIDKGRVVLKDTFSNHWVSNRYLFKSDGTGHDSVFLFDAVDSASKVWPDDWVHTGGFSIAPISNGVTPFIQLNATGTGSWDGSVSTILSDLQSAGLIPDAKGGHSALLPRASDEGYLGTNNLRWSELHATDLSCNSIDLNSRNPEVTISSGAVTVTESFHKVDTEANAATDDLDTINGGRDGQVLILVASSGARDVVIKNGTGNIACGADITLDSLLDTVTLFYDNTQSKWLLIASSNNS